MAKIESGHAEWHNTDVDMVALVRQAAQTVQELLREKGATLALQLPDAVPGVRADADRLTQVLLNLLSNAAKFVPQPGGRVQLRLWHDAQGITVEVQDNGPGVPDAQRELIFEKFRQVGDTLTEKPPGTGLGLAICRRMVEVMDGTISCRGEAGRGACFTIRVPSPEVSSPQLTSLHAQEDCPSRPAPGIA
jgi:signal transduction histidine kinase